MKFDHNFVYCEIEGMIILVETMNCGVLGEVAESGKGAVPSTDPLREIGIDRDYFWVNHWCEIFDAIIKPCPIDLPHSGSQFTPFELSTVCWTSSFQAEFPAGRQQNERFAKTFLLRLFPFGRLDPTDVRPLIRRCQLFEILPSAWIGLQRLLNVGWEC